MKRAVRIGVGGPVGSGKTMLIERLTRKLNDEYNMAVITNDIYTKEDAQFMVKNSVLGHVDLGLLPGQLHIFALVHVVWRLRRQNGMRIFFKFNFLQITFPFSIAAAGCNQKIIRGSVICRN